MKQRFIHDNKKTAKIYKKLWRIAERSPNFFKDPLKIFNLESSDHKIREDVLSFDSIIDTKQKYSNKK